MKFERSRRPPAAKVTPERRLSGGIFQMRLWRSLWQQLRAGRMQTLVAETEQVFKLRDGKTPGEIPRLEFDYHSGLPRNLCLRG